MASIAKRLPLNVDGDFFVDSTCIDCDTCRQIAPETFAQGNDQSFVHRQPNGKSERDRALAALVSCPTASIGSVQKQDLHEAFETFPERIEDEVYYCGFVSRHSFGASSYLVV